MDWGRMIHMRWSEDAGMERMSDDRQRKGSRVLSKISLNVFKPFQRNFIYDHPLMYMLQVMHEYLTLFCSTPP